MTTSVSLLTHHVSSSIRAELARQRQTQGWLADELGMSRTTLYRRLAGKTPYAVDDLFDIANALNVELGTLLPSEGALAS